MKPFTHALALGFYSRVPTEGSCKRLFCFYGNRQGALADGLHGLNPRITAHRYTPVQKATSVDCATGKAIGTSVEQGQSYKRSNPSCELGAFFVLRHVKAWRGKEEIVSIHPWRTVQQRK